jgi:hypothetical protein
VGAGDGEVTPAPGIAPRLAAGPSTPAGADVDAQLAQARELEAKLAEEYRTVRLLRASMAGEASARGERARKLGKQARDRINADFNVDNPDTPPRASQKLIAAATLLQAMPPPSTPRRETCTAKCRHSSSRRPSSRPKARRHAFANRGMHEATGSRRGANPRSMQVKRRSDPPTRDARWPRSGSSTRSGHWTATPATSSMLGVRARRIASGGRLPPSTGWTLRQ